MHRVVLDQLENVLASAQTAETASAWKHLAGCDGCRAELAGMQEHTAGMRSFRTAEDLEPRPGFYARVMERIEAEGPVSIWNLFMESPFGKRIAVASFALVLLLGVYLVSAERSSQEPMMAAGSVLVDTLPEGAIQMVNQQELDAATVQGLLELDPFQLQQLQIDAFPMQPSSGGPVSQDANFTESAAGGVSDDAVLQNFMTYREQ